MRTLDRVVTLENLNRDLEIEDECGLHAQARRLVALMHKVQTAESLTREEVFEVADLFRDLWRCRFEMPEKFQVMLERAAEQNEVVAKWVNA